MLITPEPLTLSINNQPLLEKRCNNTFLRTVLTKEFFPCSLKRKHILKDYSSDTKRIRCKFHSFPISPKAKEVHFKTMNDIYPYGEFLRLKFNLNCDECAFCKTEVETLEHLMFSCSLSFLFWKKKLDNL